MGVQDDDGNVEVEIEAGGRYLTPVHLSTVAQTQTDMQMHMQAHQMALTVPAQQGQTSTEGASKSKPAKLDRPKVELDMTEPEWGLFVAEWGRYCRSCKLSESQEKVDQLWGCLSPALKRAAAGDGLEGVTDDVAFLGSVKRLAVKKHNPVVAQVKFLSTGQDRDEPVNSYVARLRGTAQQCNFVMSSLCSSPSCSVSTEVSYADRMISHMLVRGMEDLGMQEKVLTTVAEKGEQSLSQLVRLIEAMETSKRSQGLMSGGQLNRLGMGKPGKPTAKSGSQGGSGAQGGRWGGGQGSGRKEFY